MLIFKVIAVILLITALYNALQLYVFKLTYTPYTDNLIIKLIYKIMRRAV